MNKFFKDPWNQLALIVFAMSLSYILLKYDYYHSALQRTFSPIATHAKTKSVPNVVPDKTVEATPDRQPQSIENEMDKQEAAAEDSIPVTRIPQVNDTNSLNDVNNMPSVIPSNAVSPDLAAAIVQVRTAYNAQFNSGGSLSGVSGNVSGSNDPSALPPPTQGFSPNDVKISGKGFVKSLQKKSRTDNEWILDINNGPGSDSDSINQIMHAAKKGDTIRIRNGRYHEKCDLRLDVNIIGESQNGVIIDIEDNVFTDKENFTWQNFTLNLRYENRYGFILVADSTANIKNVTLTNTVFSFTRSKVVAESITIKNSNAFAAVLNLRDSIGTFSKFKVENLDGDVISLRDGSEATISDIEVQHIKGAVVAVYKSVAIINNVKAEDVDSFGFHFAENTKHSSIKNFSCLRCKYGVYITNSTSVDVDYAEIIQTKRLAFVVDKSTSKLSNLKIDGSDSAISINQSTANISFAVIKGCRTGISVYDFGGGYKVSNVYANAVTMTTTTTPWDWKARSNSGSRLTGAGNSPEINYKVNDNKQGKQYVRY